MFLFEVLGSRFYVSCFSLGVQIFINTMNDCGEKSRFITMIPASAFVLENRWPSSLWLQAVSKWQ
jgi:hypothetical protein